MLVSRRMLTFNAHSAHNPPNQPPSHPHLSKQQQVEVVGVSEALKRVAYEALTTRPNFAYTLKEVEADLKRVFATGERE